MQLRYLKNLHPPDEGMSKVTSISWSANTTRLATVGADKIVQLFDEQGDKQDRFQTKPADKAAARAYTVKTIEFSPDGTKLAVAQSDNIVFVYKLGADWKDKKSICNKFQQTSSVTCLTWPGGHPNEVVFGLAEGKVKVGQLKSNKAATLYSTDSFVVSMCSGPDGNSILSGHIDGSIYRFHFETETVPRPTTTKFAMVPQCVPYALSWGYAGICAAGNDRMVRFWDSEGREGQSFDYSTDSKIKEFTCAAFNPSGESVVLGNYNRILVFAWHPKRSEWAEVVQREVPNLYSVTALTWRADGSRLIVGSLCGGVDMFDVCIRRSRYRGTHEFTYVSLSQVIVKSIATGHRIVLKSNVGFEIQKINIFQDRFLVANTPESILLGDLQTYCLASTMMFLAAVILLGASAAVVQVPSGISVAHREKRVLDPEQESFNLDDVIHGNKKMPGMGAWSSIFQKLGSNKHIDAEALQNMLQSVGEDLEGAYVDPGLKQDLENQTIQKQIQNITADKVLLTKVVQENAMVQQMMAVNPKLAELVKSPEALQRILSPEILQKVQHGGLDEDTLESLMETPTSSKSLSSGKETQESNLGNQTNLLPKMLSSNVPAMLLESGLMLKQVMAGDGRTFPKDGDKLFVEYAGYLPNGQLFDSTKNGDLFSFQLGASQVIRGWEVGLSHMSLGERAVMRVPAALAYGEAGTGPIPPNSDLFFEVELHGINSISSINSINALTSN